MLAATPDDLQKKAWEEAHAILQAGSFEDALRHVALLDQQRREARVRAEETLAFIRAFEATLSRVLAWAERKSGLDTPFKLIVDDAKAGGEGWQSEGVDANHRSREEWVSHPDGWRVELKTTSYLLLEAFDLKAGTERFNTGTERYFFVHPTDSFDDIRRRLESAKTTLLGEYQVALLEAEWLRAKHQALSTLVALTRSGGAVGQKRGRKPAAPPDELWACVEALLKHPPTTTRLFRKGGTLYFRRVADLMSRSKDARCREIAAAINLDRLARLIGLEFAKREAPPIGRGTGMPKKSS
jgi:hypothetical protein